MIRYCLILASYEFSYDDSNYAGMGKQRAKIPYTMRLIRLVAKIQERLTKCASTPKCALADIWLVVLRPTIGGMITHGVFMKDMLEWKVWQAGLKNGDIVHVIAPLPPDWYLSEDVAEPVRLLRAV